MLVTLEAMGRSHNTSLSSKILAIIVPLLRLQVTRSEPYTQSLLQGIHTKIIQPAQLSTQEKEELIAAADMYELKLFPAYFADQLYKMHQADINSIDKIVQTYDNRPEFQKKVARFLFLLHGIKLDNIDWEISVQDLIDYNKVDYNKTGRISKRSIRDDFLQLNDLHISDLTGLNTIENKSDISQIILTGNKLTHIGAGAFKGFSLIALNLGNNNIASIDQAAFRGIDHVSHIELDNNNIANLDLDTFKDKRFTISRHFE